MWLISLGTRLARIEEAEPETPVIKRQTGKPLDAAVEVDNKPLEWQPEQKGNVVIVEPMLMTLDRKQHDL